MKRQYSLAKVILMSLAHLTTVLMFWPSAKALADGCPTITGSYRDAYHDFAWGARFLEQDAIKISEFRTQIVTQSIAGDTQYTLTTSFFKDGKKTDKSPIVQDFIVDGKQHQTTDLTTGKQISYTAACLQNGFKIVDSSDLTGLQYTIKGMTARGELLVIEGLLKDGSVDKARLGELGGIPMLKVN